MKIFLFIFSFVAVFVGFTGGTMTECAGFVIFAICMGSAGIIEAIEKGPKEKPPQRFLPPKI